MDLDRQADILIQKVRHYLITMLGVSAEQANNDEFYRALCWAMREELTIHWTARARTIQDKDPRQVYYLSMEYLPGRFFSNNITNLNSMELVRLVLHKINRSFAEIDSRERDPGLGNGGLGRLASCFLDSLATHNYPARGYGLRYQYGTFEQQLWDGVQIEAPDCWLMRQNPWEFRRDLRRVNIRYGGWVDSDTNLHGDEIHHLHDFEEVWAIPFDLPIVGYAHKGRFSITTLRLWSTKESPRNFQLQRYNAGRLDQAAENSTLTDVLYPSDHHETGKRVRLKQEFLLVSASLQDIVRRYLRTHENFRQFTDKVRIQINDTHPALVIPELIRLLTKRYDLPWKTAVEMTQEVTGYTNHTILTEALETWDQNLVAYLLPRQYKVIERINQEFCDATRSAFPGDEKRIKRMSIIEEGLVRMAPLAIAGSHRVNGVAKLHTEILKGETFQDFYEMQPDKFVNITNGVTQRRWLLHCNPDLAKLITRRIGEEWVYDFTHIQKLHRFAEDPETQEAFLQVKHKNKLRLIQHVQQKKIRDAKGMRVFDPPIFETDALFDVQIKRIHEYKRQLLMALHVLILYNEMKANPKEHGRVKRACLIAGKAAAGYQMAKDIIQLIHCIGRKINHDPELSHGLTLFFVENYNVSQAEIIIPAAELSEQISTAGMEASGTGNMKLAMNGALTIGTADGANIEMKESVTPTWWPFTLGKSAEEIHALRESGSYNPWDLCAEHPHIRAAVEHLRDGSLTETKQEHEALHRIYDQLVEGKGERRADRYFVLLDLIPYYETQKRVEELYRTPLRWAEFALHNIAAMGPFSADRSIKDYADRVWGIEPCPTDPAIVDRVRHEYSSYESRNLLVH